MRPILYSAVVLMMVAGLGAFDSARAAALAFDSAADPAYVPDPNTGQLPAGVNGGYGWEPWEETYSGFSNFTPDAIFSAIPTSGFTWQSPITSPGAMWRLPMTFAGFTPPTFIGRYFDGALAVGQTLSFDCEGVPTIFILSADGIGATYMIDGNPYRISFENSLPLTSTATDVYDTIAGAHISITPIDSNHATLSITSYGPNGTTESLEMPYADVEGVAFEEAEHLPAYVNNLSVSPEPASAALIAAAGLGLLLRRGRRTRS